MKQMHHYIRLSPEIIRKVNFIFVGGEIKVTGKGRLKRPRNLTITYRRIFAEIKKHFTLKTPTLSWCKKYFCFLNEICSPFSLDGNKTQKHFLSISVCDPFLLHGSRNLSHKEIGKFGVSHVLGSDPGKPSRTYH